MIRPLGTKPKLYSQKVIYYQKARMVQIIEVFTSVFAPRKSYPAIVRFHDLDGVEIFKGQNLTKERSDQQTALINALENSNPALKGKFHSVRLLYNRPNTKSFLARIAVFVMALSKAVVSCWETDPMLWLKSTQARKRENVLDVFNLVILSVSARQNSRNVVSTVTRTQPRPVPPRLPR